MKIEEMKIKDLETLKGLVVFEYKQYKLIIKGGQ